MGVPLVKHKFNSGKGDGIDSTRVRPINWNDQHDLKVASKSLLGALAAGDVVELPLVTTATGDDGTMMTKAAMDAAIAAALVGVDIPATGDLCASLAAAKPNWLLLNGQTIGNVGSPALFANANAHALFTLLWNINGATWPVLPTRGLVSADDDWNTGHIIAIPDARGCAIGMLDLTAGVNSLLALLGVKVGAQKKALVIEEIPSHTHLALQAKDSAGSGGGSGVYVNSFSVKTATDATGGDPLAAPPNSVARGFDIVQPTMGANIFIRL